MKKLIYVLGIIVLFIPTVLLNSVDTRALEKGELYLNYTNFPDEHLREYLRDNYDTDGDGIIQVEDVKVVDLYNDDVPGDANNGKVKNLKGIELLTSLEELDCSGTETKTLDLSNMKNLKKLVCKGVKFTNNEDGLNLTGTTNLEYIDISYTYLNNLDLSDCINLKIFISLNSGTRCDFSNNTNLEYLDCSYCDYTELDLSKNTKLKELKIVTDPYSYDEVLNYIDLSNNVNLERCTITSQKADLSKCSKLKYLRANCLEEYDLSQLSSLEELELIDYDNSDETVLNLNNCIKLDKIYINLSNCEKIILPDNNTISSIDLYSQKLSEINLSECKALKNIYIRRGNNLIADVSKSENIEVVDIYLPSVKKFYLPKTGFIKELTLREGHSTGKLNLSSIEGIDYYQITDSGWDSANKILSYKPWEATDNLNFCTGYNVDNEIIDNFVIYFDTYEENYNLTYCTHVQTYGWQDEVLEGEVSGTTGESKRLEGIIINFEGNKLCDIRYTTHVQSYGWLPWCRSGEFSGTEGESKRMEAIMIDTVGEEFDIYYRVHAQSYGWLGWAKNGEPAGTAGYSKRLEGIQIVAVKKGEDFDRNMKGITSVCDESYIAKEGASPIVGHPDTSAINPEVPVTANVAYRTHVQTYGWQGWKYNGQTSGTSGESKRLEGIKIKLSNLDMYVDGSVLYTTHVQSYGWLDNEYDPSTWSKDGEFSGTEGESKRLEAIRIMLSGDVANH